MCKLCHFYFFFQYSWKLLHPTDSHMNQNCPKDAEEYERVRAIVVAATNKPHGENVIEFLA